MKELHPSLSLPLELPDQSGLTEESSKDGTNFLKKLMPKHLQKQKEFGMIDFMKEIDFDAWMEIGLEKGWCGPPVCYVHDGLPMSEEEWIEEEVKILWSFVK
jgi:hypothetical protein